MTSFAAALVGLGRLHFCWLLSTKWFRQHFVEGRFVLVLARKNLSLAQLAVAVVAAAVAAVAVAAVVVVVQRTLLPELSLLA